MPVTVEPQAKALHNVRNKILAPNFDTLSIARGKATKDTPKKIFARHKGTHVEFYIDGKIGQITTEQAHEMGKAIIFLALNSGPDEAVQVIVNRERKSLTLEQAKNLAKGLLRKADSADDFQIHHNVRLVK